MHPNSAVPNVQQNNSQNYVSSNSGLQPNPNLSSAGQQYYCNPAHQTYVVSNQAPAVIASSQSQSHGFQVNSSGHQYIQIQPSLIQQSSVSVPVQQNLNITQQASAG